MKSELHLIVWDLFDHKILKWSDGGFKKSFMYKIVLIIGFLLILYTYVLRIHDGR